MTDEHYESLRRHILDLKVEISELKLMIKKQNEIADYRFSLLYEWCAPSAYKAMTESTSTGIPADLKKFFGG